ncbi:hypothetical protein [Dankookia rubra]|uniref:hypothetical protein n=1 Tax=Dankookia rubra TaxID=1442381 RepID=UPI001F4F4CC2|nr:hypothetical protein [Dankookia rubra]
MLVTLVAERANATLASYAGMLAERVGRQFSAPVTRRALPRAGLRWNEKTLHASEQEPANVAAARAPRRDEIACQVYPDHLLP